MSELGSETPGTTWQQALKNPEGNFVTPEQIFQLVKERRDSSGKEVIMLPHRQGPSSKNLGPNEWFWNHVLLEADGKDNIENIYNLVRAFLQIKNEGLILDFDLGKSSVISSDAHVEGFENAVAIFLTSPGNPRDTMIEVNARINQLLEEAIRSRKQQSGGEQSHGIISRLLKR